jgi:hypothetical protein
MELCGLPVSPEPERPRRLNELLNFFKTLDGIRYYWTGTNYVRVSTKTFRLTEPVVARMLAAPPKLRY